MAWAFFFSSGGECTTDPKIEGTFKLEIRGRQINRAAVSIVRELITGRVKKIDPKIELDTRTFGDIGVVMTWTGIPKDIGQAQTLITALKYMVSRYFEAWIYTIEIKLNEKGG